MLKKEKIELRAANVGVEDKSFIIIIRIFNPERRTLYAYVSPRRILYDNATGKLALYLHDQDVEEHSIISHQLSEPNFTALEGTIETEVEISLPKVVNRIKSTAERGGSGPLTEQLQIAEAKEIELEIAHQDTPFYHNPKIDNAKQLKEWGRVIAKANFKLTTPKIKKAK